MARNRNYFGNLSSLIVLLNFTVSLPLFVSPVLFG